MPTFPGQTTNIDDSLLFVELLHHQSSSLAPSEDSRVTLSLAHVWCILDEGQGEQYWHRVQHTNKYTTNIDKRNVVYQDQIVRY